MDPQNPPSAPPPAAPPPYAPPGGAGGPFAQVDPQIRNLAIGLFVLAALVLIGTFTSSWATASERGGDIGAGLTSLEMSGKRGSVSISWGDTPISGDVVFFGYLALIGGLASVAGTVAMGVFAITNKPNKIPSKIFNIVLGVTAFAMTSFLIRLLTAEKLKGLSISYSGIIAIGGLIGISVVVKMLTKLKPV